MKRLNWNWGLACGFLLVAACGGKTDDKGDEPTTSNAGDGDGDVVGDGDGDAVGDGDGDGSPTSSDNKAEGCATVCASAEACGATEEDCVESCTENESVSNAGQDALAECFDDVSCTATETELLDAFLCVGEELEDTPLSTEQRQFCEVTSKSVQECTGEEPDPTLGDCAAQIGLVSDELLGDINGCDQADCDALQACVSLQLFQGIDLAGVTAITSSGEISAGGLSDLLVLFVVANQVGADTGLEGIGGSFGAP